VMPSFAISLLLILKDLLIWLSCTRFLAFLAILASPGFDPSQSPPAAFASILAGGWLALAILAVDPWHAQTCGIVRLSFTLGMFGNVTPPAFEPFGT
jgi:hypothetical protein